MSLCGLRGINLSGGQRQRVNVARAAYAPSDLILLDNALSAVDHHTAHDMFRECLRGRMADKAVIFITHQVEVCHASSMFSHKVVLTISRDIRVVPRTVFGEVRALLVHFGHFQRQRTQGSSASGFSISHVYPYHSLHQEAGVEKYHLNVMYSDDKFAVVLWMNSIKSEDTSSASLQVMYHCMNHVLKSS